MTPETFFNYFIFSFRYFFLSFRCLHEFQKCIHEGPMGSDFFTGFFSIDNDCVPCGATSHER